MTIPKEGLEIIFSSKKAYSSHATELPTHHLSSSSDVSSKKDIIFFAPLEFK